MTTLPPQQDNALQQQDLVRITIEYGTNLLPSQIEQDIATHFQKGIYLSIKLYDASLTTSTSSTPIEETIYYCKTSAVIESPLQKWIWEQDYFFSLDPYVDEYIIEIEVLETNLSEKEDKIIGFGKQKLEPFSERISIPISSIWNSSITCNVDYILDKGVVIVYNFFCRILTTFFVVPQEVLDLIQALANNEKNSVKTILNNSLLTFEHFFLPDSHGNTIFHAICEQGNPDTLKLILEKFSKLIPSQTTMIHLNSINAKGLTPFQLSILYGNQECASILLDFAQKRKTNHCSVILFDELHRSILKHSLVQDNVMVHFVNCFHFFLPLCSGGFCFEQFDMKKYQKEANYFLHFHPLFLSVLYNRRRSFEELYSTIQTIPHASWITLACVCLASLSGSIELLDALLPKVKDISEPLFCNYSFSSPLFFALIGMKERVIFYLIEKGAILRLEETIFETQLQAIIPFPILQKALPLLISCKLKFKEEFLLTLYRKYFRFRVLDIYKPSLLVLCSVLCPKLCTLLSVEDKVKPEILSKELDATALHFIAKHGTAEEAKEFLSQLTNSSSMINCINSRGRTPLHEAAWNDNLSTIEFLCENGADSTAQDMEENTPLVVAVQNACQCAAAFLYKKRLEEATKLKDEKNMEGLKKLKTVIQVEKKYDIFIAAMFGKRKLALNSFKNQVADVDMVTIKGTALHYCCTAVNPAISAIDPTYSLETVGKNQEIIANGLIELKCPLNFSNSSFHSPILTAVLHHREDMAKLLLEKGADFSNVLFYLLETNASAEVLEKWIHFASSICTMNFNQVDSLQRSLIHIAALHKHEEFLLDIVPDLIQRFGNHTFAILLDEKSQTPLHYLAQSAISVLPQMDAEMTEQCLVLGNDPLIVDTLGHTCFYYSLKRYNFTLVDTILQIKGKEIINASNELNETLLQELMNSEKEELFCRENWIIFEYLIKRGVDLMQKNRHGNSFFYLLLLSSKQEQAYRLLDSISTALLFQQLTIQDAQTGNTLLHQLLQTNSSQVSVTLLEYFETRQQITCHILPLVNKNNETLLHIALKSLGKNSSIPVYLIQLFKEKVETADINGKDSQGNSVLHLAIQNGCTAAVKLLLEQSPNVNLKNELQETCLDVALRCKAQLSTDDFDNIVFALLQRGTIVTRTNFDQLSKPLLTKTMPQWDLSLLIKNGHWAKALELIRLQSDPNLSTLLIPNSKSALMAAIEFEDANLVKELILHGANLNIVDEEENTPLHLCSKRGLVNLVTDLLRMDKKQQQLVNAVNKYKRTALQEVVLARPQNMEQIVTLLMDHGCSSSIRDLELRNALHLYCLKNSNKETLVAELLIEKDAQIVIQSDKYGMNPFHLAAQSDNPHLIQTLLRYRHLFDMYAKDRSGKTAFEYVLSDTCRKIIKGQYVRGWLSKKGQKGLLKLFRKRYFVMNEETIKYYKDEQETEEKGYIDIESIKKVKRSSEPLKFEIHMKGGPSARVYELQAEDKIEFDKWFFALHKRFQNKS